MKLKYRNLKNVSVFCKGKFYNFIDGAIEASDEEAKELLKNPNISLIEEIITEETTAENIVEKTGKKGKK